MQSVHTRSIESINRAQGDNDVSGPDSALQGCRLDQPLQSWYLRLYFLYRVFGFDSSPAEGTDDAFESYFNRYAILCKMAANKVRAIENVNHWQMANIVTLLHVPSLTKEQVLEQCLVLIKGTDERMEWNSFDVGVILVDVAVHLWLMLSIGRFPGDISYDEPILWDLGESQDALLKRHFSSKHQSDDFVKLPQTFTAAHLEQIAGIEVVWTNNLADHLLLKDDDTKLMLFHQVSILQLHLGCAVSTLPKTLVNETIRSISLLVPPILGDPNPWFQQQRQKSLVDSSAGVCDRLNSSERQIDKFLYWRDRLVLLKRTFDDAEPRNISQLWFDDRKKTQWFTFWVAVLVFVMTVFFGVIQSVAGIVQAWASVQSLKSQDSSK